MKFAAKFALLFGFVVNAIVYRYAPELRQRGGDLETVLLVQASFLAGLAAAPFLASKRTNRNRREET